MHWNGLSWKNVVVCSNPRHHRCGCMRGLGSMAPISIVKPISPLAINRARRLARMICPRSSCLALHAEHLSLPFSLSFALSLCGARRSIIFLVVRLDLLHVLFLLLCDHRSSCSFFTGGITRALQETQPPQQTQQPCGDQVCVKST